MVQIIIFLLLFVNNILCESIYQKISTNSIGSYKAELQFEDDFKTIKSWTVSDFSANIVGSETTCFGKKDEMKIECFCEGGVNCISPYFIMETIHQWNKNTRSGNVNGYQPDIEFEQEIRKTVIKTIRSVINTFATDDCARSDPNTGSLTVCHKTYKFDSCTFKEVTGKTSAIGFDTKQFNTDRFPQFSLQRNAIAIISIHPPLREFGENQLKSLYGYLLFEFSGNRDAFWCGFSENDREVCDEAELKKRFNCVISGLRAKANINPPSFNPPTSSNNQSNVEFRHSSDFKFQDLSGLGVFLLLFVIPIISLCVFYLIPDKIDHTPLDPTKFAEYSKIREKVRLAEQTEDKEKP